MTVEDEGLLSVKHGILSWETLSGVVWRLPCAKIAVVGEWMYDDSISISRLAHSIVFVNLEKQWVWAPVVAAGFEFAMADLQAYLPDFNADLRLFGTTEASRIIWPSIICDDELFDYYPLHSQTLIDWLLAVFAKKYEMRLSLGVLAEVERRKQQA